MPATIEHTVCRVCHVQCGLTVEMVDGQPGRLHGDKDNPAFHGYSCVKGRQMAAFHTAPTRLLHSQKRRPDGGFAPIESGAMTNEIADKLGDLVARHGPRSVAVYIGTFGYQSAPAFNFAQALMAALDSPMFFTSVTIDQPGKAIAASLHGFWLAGTPPMDDWDVLTLVGTNPVVSMNGGLGPNPARQLHNMKKRGMKLIVLDPRRSDVAEKADIYLPVKPGEDPAVLAAIAHVLIADGLIDHEFVREETVGLAALRTAVAPFTPEFAGAQAGVDPAQIVAAARLIGQARRGAFSAGTGPNMAGHGNLIEYMLKVLTTLRGFWRRAGDAACQAGVMINPFPAIAGTPGPSPVEFGETLRVKNLRATAAGLPTAALADEILLEGEGQIKALLVMGGNPMLAWPDQLKTAAAMRKLELLVCFDPHMSATARLAHYVVAPKLPLEIHGCTVTSELFGSFGPGWGYEAPYAQWAEPLIAPPAGADVVEDWAVLRGIAARLGKTLRLNPYTIIDPAAAAAAATEILPEQELSPLAMWEMLLKGAPMPFSEIRTARQGRNFERPVGVVAPRPADWTGRLDLGAAPMMWELGTLFAHAPDLNEYPFRLISRRLHDVMNSAWHEDPVLRRRVPTNYAFINPADMARLGIAADDIVEVASAHGAIRAMVAPAPDVRTGSISMAHAWGRNPDEPDDPAASGGNTSRLTSVTAQYDRYTGIPLMSAIPVRLTRHEAPAPQEVLEPAFALL